MKKNLKLSKDLFIEIKPTSGTGKGGKLFKEKLANILKENYNSTKVNDVSYFEITMIFFFKDERKKIDLDNLVKPVLDAFIGLIYKDDTQVFGLNLKKRYNQIINGISIKIYKQ